MTLYPCGFRQKITAVQTERTLIDKNVGCLTFTILTKRIFKNLTKKTL